MESETKLAELGKYQRAVSLEKRRKRKLYERNGFFELLAVGVIATAAIYGISTRKVPSFDDLSVTCGGFDTLTNAYSVSIGPDYIVEEIRRRRISIALKNSRGLFTVLPGEYPDPYVSRIDFNKLNFSIPTNTAKEGSATVFVGSLTIRDVAQGKGQPLRTVQFSCT